MIQAQNLNFGRPYGHKRVSKQKLYLGTLEKRQNSGFERQKRHLQDSRTFSGFCVLHKVGLKNRRLAKNLTFLSFVGDIGFLVVSVPCPVLTSAECVFWLAIWARYPKLPAFSRFAANASCGYAYPMGSAGVNGVRLFGA